MNCHCQISVVMDGTEISQKQYKEDEEIAVYGTEPTVNVSIVTADYAKMSKEEEVSYLNTLKRRIDCLYSLNLTHRQMVDFRQETVLHVIGLMIPLNSIQSSCEKADIDIRWDGEVLDLRNVINIAREVLIENDY